MDDGRRKLLRSMRVYLINNLTRLEEVLDILEADHIISEDQRRRILCSSIPKDQVRNFLDIIVRCGPRAFNSFQCALEETKQESILDAIRTESFKLVPESVSPSVSAHVSSSSNNQGITSTTPEIAAFPTLQPFEPYTVTSVPHGYILIINVENYTIAAGVSNRLGSGEDVKKLRGLFEEFCYGVIVLQDPSGRQVEDAVRTFAQKPEHMTADAGGLVVLAHGMEHHIIASDASLVKIDDLASCFTNTSCPGLRGKPKLLIFQACRGVNIDHGIHLTPTNQAIGLTTVVDHSLDPASWLALPHMSDCVIVYSTLPGFVSWRSETGGSLYISTFVDVFRLHGHRCHVMDLLAEVNNRLVQEAPELNLHQISQPVHTLRKPFYLSTKKQSNNSQS
ncbi:unnamed protein product [Dicrocoelium dendriticum]|nr:unnamed protein product [Dicrocoelium dendriticum]